MKIADLIMLRPGHESMFANDGIDIGVILEKSVRGPTPGATILWPMCNRTEWIRLEDLKCVNLGQLPTKGDVKL